MSEFNLKNTILTDIMSDEYLNRRIYMQQPIMWWKNDVTQLNATNLNKISMGIRDVQQEFSIESHNIQYLLGQTVKNSAGWLSTENASGTAEIFNDYDNNQALADYSHAEGHITKAGHGYSSLEDGHVIYSGIGSHAQGEGTVAIGDYQFVQGRWNILDAVTHPNNSGELIPTNESNDVKGTYAHIVGAGTDDTNRKNIYTLDWSGSGWFANELIADGNVTFGTNGDNRHKFKGKTLFENAVKINSNLGVYGETKLDKTLNVNGAVQLSSTLSVVGLTILNGDLKVITDANISGKITSKDLEVSDSTTLNGSTTINGESEFTNKVTFSGLDKEVVIESPLVVEGQATFVNASAANLEVENLDVILSATLKETQVNGDLDVTGTIICNTDVKVVSDEGNTTQTITLTDEHNHLDYASLVVNDQEAQTVPNAIKFTEDKLIGKLTLNTENLGQITPPALTSESIYGVAQYSINLVKNLLNAYILDGDNDDPEVRSAIDKLIEVADWIKDDSAGAGKIISDVEDLGKNKLDSSTFTDFKTKEYDVLSKLISDNNFNWNTAFKNNHTHTNKEILDGITSTKVSNWNTAYSQSHSHSNKDLLDNITEDRLTKWDASSALLDGVSQEAIDGVIADGQRITDNTNRLNQVDQTFITMNSEIKGMSDEIDLINEAIGSNNVSTSIIGRLKALEDKLNTLITYGSNDPTSNTNTLYYVKHE